MDKLYQSLHEYLIRSAILRDFQNQEYQFTIPKSQKTRLAEKLRDNHIHEQAYWLIVI